MGRRNGAADAVDVVAVGSVGLDDIETPFGREGLLLGGSMSYACAAASFFARTGMVGIVGHDFPEAYVELYRGFGIDVAGLHRAEGETFRWSGVYEPDMINRRTVFTRLNVFADFAPRIPAAYRGAPFVLLGNIAPALQLGVLGQMDRPRFVVADTMDLWIDTARPALMDLIGRVTMLTLNDAEARLLAGEHHLLKCARKILGWGPKWVVVKKGEHGAMLFSRDGCFLVPAFPVEEVRDPTGAGDAFAGGFVGALAEAGRVTAPAVRRALLCGSVVASFAVEDFSVRRLVPLRRRDIERRLRELQRMVAV
jgi:sugar/nucleoside kinase (ribokinase family)